MRFVIDARYAGRPVSGVGNYVRALAGRLPNLSRSSEFRYWVPEGTAALSGAPNVSHHVVSAIPNGLRTLFGTAYFDQLRDDDVLHLPANLLGFGVRCRTVVTVHDLMWIEHTAQCQPNPLLRPISRSYYGLGIGNALRRADRILTVSRASADAIVRHRPEAARKVVVTPNACEPGFRPAENAARAREKAAGVLGFDAPFFLVVGQNQPSKGHGVALEALSLARLPRHRLVLVQRLLPGRGLHRRAVELGVGERAHFVPTLGFDQLLCLLHSATALLQPSFAEGFGLPALEAAASGCPVIASDIPPLREVLGPAGLFFPAGDAGRLARELERVVADASLRDELRGSGVERARGFSWDETAKTTMEVYSDVANGVIA